MNVLHVAPHLGREEGGSVTVALGLADAQARAGLNVRLWSTDHGQPRPEASLACEVRLFPCRFCGWRYAPGLGRWLGREAAWADIVHVHTVWMYPTQAAARACWRAGVPYVLTPHGMLEEPPMGQSGWKRWKKQAYGAALELSTLRRARAIHWASEVEKARSRHWAGGLPDFVAPVGITPTPAVPDVRALRRRLPALGEARVLLFLGRLHPRKQAEVAIRALAGVRAVHADTALVVAGPGDARYVESLRALARGLGLEPWVHFTGLLDAGEVREALAASAVMLMPSTHEAFGLAAAEAMAAGCPVVVTPEVALAPVVTERRCGAVAPATPHDFAAAAIALLADEEERRRAGARARAVAVERFGWPVIARHVIAAYESALGRAEPSQATA